METATQVAEKGGGVDGLARVPGQECDDIFVVTNGEQDSTNKRGRHAQLCMMLKKKKERKKTIKNRWDQK